ncbi:MAG: hypothetical protein Q9208_000038 [Pyrenodesmia sp. 3 TL-2023]
MSLPLQTPDLSKTNERESEAEGLPAAQSSSAESSNACFPLTGPVERYVNEEGKVAVMYKSGYGGGWSSLPFIHSNNPKEQEIRAFDKDIVAAVLKKDYKLAASLVKLKVSGVDYEDKGSLECATRHVRIDWLDPGQEIRISEYDGDESIVFKRDVAWLRV